ncbi:protein GDAP2 homolog [Culicoides brevitarsis]|uniref:protein GDAP2 homolog n=1 Tax=Culicoides brevitarsis TaxID=469753 RepID=UPI00307B2139
METTIDFDTDSNGDSRYDQLLKQSSVEDLREISGVGFLYQSGFDRLNRPVIVLCGKWFKANKLNLDKVVLYIISLLDSIVKNDYVMVYFHTRTESANVPPLSWIKELYYTLTYKYKKNLKSFYIVHPTVWTKMMTWWFLTFMAPAIKHKVHNVEGLEYLYSAIAKDQLEIPAYIVEYDMTINGLHYAEVNSNSLNE